MKRNKMGSLPLVSVNIRTFNSGKTLDATLESVKKQSYPKIEIVISDGYSQDKSLEIAKKYGGRVSFSDNLGDARFQNYKNSRGKYVISLDSDQIMDKKLIGICVDLCENENFDTLIISEKSMVKNGTFLEKLLAYDKWLIDQVKDADVVFGTACPRFFRRDLLRGIKWPKKLGIFDDTILYDQLLKKGVKIEYVANQSIRHHEVSNWVTLVKKFHKYGKSYFVALKENPPTIVGHSLPRRSYFSKAALSKPHYFLGLLLLYAIKTSAAFTGVIAYFIIKLAHKLQTLYNYP